MRLRKIIRNRFFSRILALCFAVVLCHTAAYAAVQKTAAVLPFADVSGQRLGKYVTDTLLTGLFQRRPYQLVERSRLESIIKEQKLGRSGIIDPLAAASIGRVAGADYTIMGSVKSAVMHSTYVVLGNQFTAKVVLAVQIIDNTTGEIIFAEEAEGKDSVLQVKPFTKEKADMKKAADNAAAKLVDQIAALHPVEGKIAGLHDGLVYVNLGSEDGVKKGDTFLVYQEGAPIFDPDSGVILSRKKIAVGTIVITEIEPKAAIGICKEASCNIEVGQVVKRM